MGAWATILNKASIDLSWLFYVQGVVLSPAVIPIGLTVTWSKLSKAGVFCGCIIGAVLGMLAWMIGCWKIYGVINVANLAQPYLAICSSLTGLLLSGIITIAVSLWKPTNYNFKGTHAIAVYDTPDSKVKQCATPTDEAQLVTEHREKDRDPKKAVSEEQVDVYSVVITSGGETVDLATLQSVFKWVTLYFIILTLIVAIIVPLPMFFSHYVFSMGFFKFWIACTIIWVT
ncbi:Urea active transporter [Abortiporus biennis]